MKAIVLAAGVGARLAPLTDDRPKPLVSVLGVPLLFRTMDRLAEVGIKGRDVVIVAGYREDVLRDTLQKAGRTATVVSNPRYAEWNNFWSLYVAREVVGRSGFVQVDGDVLYDEKLLARMLAAPGPGTLSIDVRPELDPETMKVVAGPDLRIRAISKKLEPAGCLGEYVGVSRIDAELTDAVWEELLAMRDQGITHEYYEHAYHRLAQRDGGPFWAVDVHDCQTTEIDDLADLRRAESLVAAR